MSLYYYIDGKKKGPVSEKEYNDLVEKGDIPKDATTEKVSLIMSIINFLFDCVIGTSRALYILSKAVKSPYLNPFYSSYKPWLGWSVAIFLFYWPLYFMEAENYGMYKLINYIDARGCEISIVLAASSFSSVLNYKLSPYYMIASFFFCVTTYKIIVHIIKCIEKTVPVK